MVIRERIVVTVCDRCGDVVSEDLTAAPVTAGGPPDLCLDCDPLAQAGVVLWRAMRADTPKARRGKLGRAMLPAIAQRQPLTVLWGLGQSVLGEPWWFPRFEWADALTAAGVDLTADGGLWS